VEKDQQFAVLSKDVNMLQEKNVIFVEEIIIKVRKITEITEITKITKIIKIIKKNLIKETNFI